jgi:hypothetical protein
MSDKLVNYNNTIEDNKAYIDVLESNISNSTDTINNIDEKTYMQQSEIDKKKNVLSTRQRMLQLLEEQNNFKKKVNYSLLSVLMLLISLLTYLYYKY